MDDHVSIPCALSSAEGLKKLSGILAQPDASRAEIGRRVCGAFGFVDLRGRPQVTSCLCALRRLERAGKIVLPAPRRGGGRGSVARREEAVPEPTGLPACAGAIEGLELVRVEGPELRLVFNELMASEHPRSARLHVGRQLRYLVGSSHGWLGGLLFAPATRVLAARDAWLGWDDASRERHLEEMIGLARFLIRPSVSVRYLASRVLGMAARRVVEDFAAVYGIRPVLAETFVAPEYRGSCFLAAGWRCVGHTSGRRLRGGGAEAAKRILVLPLAADWDACLEARRVLLPGDGLDSASWAENEFGAAPLGDARLTQRLVRSAEIQARAPTKTFFAAAAGCEATVKGYYRMIEHPDYAAVSAATIVAGHRERTLRRMQGHALSLLVQDGTDLNFATRNGCEGLGTIGRNRGSSGTLGLHLHTTFAVSGDGVPLGVVNLEFDAPHGTPEPDRPVEERKTGRWLRGLRHSVAAVKELDGVKAVAVTDREGDVFDMFHEHRAAGCRRLALLVRAKHDRSLGRGRPKLFERVRAAPEAGQFTMTVDRQSARNSASGQKAFAGRTRRKARVSLRWLELAVPPPADEKARFGPEPLPLSAVHVREVDVPDDGSEPVSWILLTTLPVTGLHQAREVVRLYGLRWRIEDWHRILKSGCKVETIAHRTGMRIERAVAINAVIAWRIATLTHLARTEPELPATTAFTEIELALLTDFSSVRKLPSPKNLGQAFRLVATMGGYLNRKNDGPPGAEIAWNGQAALSFTAWMLGHSIDAGETSEVRKHIS